MVDQAEVKPEAVLVFAEHGFARGGAEALEPGCLLGRQGLELLLDGGMEIAAEPETGVVKGDGFFCAQRAGMEGGPGLPEGVVVSMSVEEGRELVDVVNDGVAGEDVAEDVKAEMAEVIDGVEGEEFDIVDGADDSALPELGGLGYGEESCAFVPEAEVQLDGERHVGVEGVAAPSPALRAGHGGGVVGATIVLPEVGLIAEGFEGGLRAWDMVGWAEEIDVGLHAQSRVGDVIGRLGEAFDDDVIDAGAIQRTCRFAVGCLDADEAQRVVGEVGLQALLDPCWFAFEL